MGTRFAGHRKEESVRQYGSLITAVFDQENRSTEITYDGHAPGVTASDFATLALAAGPVSQVKIPQAILGSTVDYHFHSGFDIGLRFNYGSYVDIIRPDQTGRLRSYVVFVGRTWYSTLCLLLNNARLTRVPPLVQNIGQVTSSSFAPD